MEIKNYNSPLVFYSDSAKCTISQSIINKENIIKIIVGDEEEYILTPSMALLLENCFNQHEYKYNDSILLGSSNKFYNEASEYDINYFITLLANYYQQYSDDYPFINVDKIYSNLITKVEFQLVNNIVVQKYINTCEKHLFFQEMNNRNLFFQLYNCPNAPYIRKSNIIMFNLTKAL